MSLLSLFTHDSRLESAPLSSQAETMEASTLTRANLRRASATLLAAILALALFLRSYNLLSLPLFTDEAIYLHWAKEIWEQRTRMALFIPISTDGKQPLFMWLAGAAMQLPTDPLLAGRAVSALTGVLSTIAVYLAGRWLLGGAVGLLAALFYAIAPFTLFFDRMALADGLLDTTTAWSLALGVLIATRVRDRRQSLLIGTTLGIVLGMAIWTKMTALFVLPFPLLGLILVLKKRDLRAPIMALLVGFGVFGIFAALLAMMPNAENLVEKTSSFSFTASELLTFPVRVWVSNLASYWSWIQLYLPSPLYWETLIALLWGLLFRRRSTLMLVGCWAAFTLPQILTARLLFTTRYVVPSVLPLLLLSADLLVWVGRLVALFAKQRLLSHRYLPVLPVAILSLIAITPSLIWDIRLLQDPSTVALADTDRFQYVSGWPSGYGFRQAMDLAQQRADELGGEVILLSDHFQGLPYDGISLYLKGHPRIHYYVDGHIPWGGQGIVEAWRPHHVPVLIIGAEGRNDLQAFERNVPEAKKIGVFPKPEGKFSFRVYEMDLR